MIGIVSQSKKLLHKLVGSPKNYTEVVEALSSLPERTYDASVLTRVAELDKACGGIVNTIDTIVVGGTNGKSTALHFAAKLFQEEKIKTAIIYSSHFLTYNERLVIDEKAIDNKQFAEVVGDVLERAVEHGLDVTAAEILYIAGLIFAKQQGCQVVLVELAEGGKYDPVSLVSPKIAAITRVVADSSTDLSQDLDKAAYEMLTIAKPGTWVVSAEQSKIRLQKMKNYVEQQGSRWAMPIRKLAPLPYMYEQLYGRVASLGERIAQIYVEEIKQEFSPFLKGNLLATQRGQRGRPTLQAKKAAELNPIKTMKMFWAEAFSLLKARFEVLEKEKPTIILDNANNIDAFMNVFLGVRLVHYQRPVKGFVLIMGVSAPINLDEFMKSVRYLLKKAPGEVFFVNMPTVKESYTAKELLAEADNYNIAARAYETLDEALRHATTMVDSKDGLITITGSPELISAYWSYKGVKKIV